MKLLIKSQFNATEEMNKDNKKAVDLAEDGEIKVLLAGSMELHEVCKAYYASQSLSNLKLVRAKVDLMTQEQLGDSAVVFSDNNYPLFYVIKSKDMDLITKLKKNESLTIESIREAESLSDENVINFFQKKIPDFFEFNELCEVEDGGTLKYDKKFMEFYLKENSTEQNNKESLI